MRLQVAKQVRHALPRRGGHHIRCNFRERHQDKCALGQPWMGNHKICFADHLVPVEQNIQIQCTRPILQATGAVTAKGTLYAE